MKTKNYGIVSSIALDPIEKKPLYHFFPGSKIISVGGIGCNMTCPFCQNHSISHPENAVDTEFLSPERLCDIALSYKDEGNIGVAFTYNEPLLYFDYIVDTANLLKNAGLKTVIVSNGCFSERIANLVCEHVDAANIDLKVFNEAGYEKIGGNLNRVKSFIEKIHENVHVEITSLIVPGLNDSESEMDMQAKWIASLSEDIPLHISRFFPNYKMKDTAPTDIALMKRLRDIAKVHLKNVYLGNVPEYLM